MVVAVASGRRGRILLAPFVLGGGFLAADLALRQGTFAAVSLLFVVVLALTLGLAKRASP